MDIQRIARVAQNDYEIMREEDNFAAILFTALCKPGTVEGFLCGIPVYTGMEVTFVPLIA